MCIRTRLTGVRCLAVLVGVMFGVLTSIRDLSQVHTTVYSVRSPPRNFSKFTLLYARLEASKSDRTGNGLIEDAKRQPVAPPPPKVKSQPIKVNLSQMTEIVNPHPFTYTLEPLHACRDPNLFLVAYIHTSPDHYERRAQIRRTWAQTSLYKDTAIEVYFMLGSTSTKEVQDRIQAESDEHQDIVQESFVDAYHNLSYKAVGAMRWVSTRCNHTKFVLKTDDDVFINTFALIKHLKDLDRAQLNNTGLLMCLVWYKMHVLREGKWKIDESVISDEFYPPYCSGMGYILSLDVAQAIYKASAYVPFFWVDDVYITGQIPKAMGLQHVDIMKLFMGRKEVDWLVNGPDWHKYIFSHLRDMTFYDKMWKKLVARAQNETIPDMARIQAGVIATNYGPKKPPEERKDVPMNKILDRRKLMRPAAPPP